MPPDLKGKLPWRLGATSYVIPGPVLDNVLLLAGTVDNVQILFFESSARSGLENTIDPTALNEIAHANSLTYTVHLPTDLRLGAADEELRRDSVDEILRVMDSLAELGPLSYDLHLNLEPVARTEWLDHLDHSLGALADHLQERRSLIAVENIDYPFELVLPLVTKHGLSVCRDFGHIARYRHNEKEALDLSPSVRHIHYHGCTNGKDHQPLSIEEQGRAEGLGETLLDIGYSGVVTLEIYDISGLEKSLETLALAWEPFVKKGGANGA